MSNKSRRRLLPLVWAVGMVVALFASAVPAHAGYFGMDDTFVRPHVVGIVTAVTGTEATPTRFTMGLGTDSIDIRITSKTTLLGRSAEATVEGFLSGDYTFAVVRKVNRDWVAVRILYDVEAFGPLRVWTGTVARVTPEGHRFVVKNDAGRSIAIRLVKKTRIRVEGKPGETKTGAAPQSVSKGDAVQVLAVKTDLGWYAADVDIKSSLTQIRFS